MGKLHEMWKVAKNNVKSPDKNWSESLGMQANFGKMLDDVESLSKDLQHHLEEASRKLFRLRLVEKTVDLEKDYANALKKGVGNRLITENDRKELVKEINDINYQIIGTLGQSLHLADSIMSSIEGTGKELKTKIS